MSDVFLNELSLSGQYSTIDDFVKKNEPVVESLRWFCKHGFVVYKKSNLYSSKITKDKSLVSLGGYRSAEGHINDLLRRFKLLLEQINSNPYWDIDPDLKSETATCNDIDVSDSSIAIAAVNDDPLISFSSGVFADKVLDVILNGNSRSVYSITTGWLLSEYIAFKKLADYDEIVKIRYRGSNLDFSELEPEYGFDRFESVEFKDCINVFDRFTKMDWDQIYAEKALHYKHYSPESKHRDWFVGSKYSGVSIDKFRCVNPKRCFGYRKGDVFHVLRMERDHSISDYG